MQEPDKFKREEQAMELLNVARARSIWLFDLYDLNPRGKSVIPDLMDWLKDAYNFSKSPTSVYDQEAETKALAFLQGHYQVREEFFIEVDLRLYNDGLIGDTRSSTDDTDLFLQDVLESASREFSLNYKPDVIRRKLHSSELNVRCDRPLENLNPKLKAISAKLSSMASTVGAPPPFEFSQIAFWGGEPLGASPIAFRLERKLNTSFSENRYYASAPLTTDQHLKLLEEIESILAG